MPYKVIAIPDSIASEVRQTHKSPHYGHPAHTELATGYGPCRSCLNVFDEHQENRILFTYQPFDGLASLPLPAPIFIHQQDCTRYEEQNGFPSALQAIPMLLECFGKDAWLVMREALNYESVDSAIERLLCNPIIDYIHLRNAEAGCFIARIERL